MCVNVDSTEYEKENTLMATETLAQVLTRLDNTAEQVAEHVFAGEIRKAVNASSDRIVHTLICLGTVRHADEESTL
jgi:hypothetical protein